MTTPNQLPIDRAFVIGGSTANPDTDTSYTGNNFGQDFSDSAVRALFEIPAITLTNVIEVFTTLLLRLPLEALKVFEPIIPGGLDNFTDVVTAVNAIVGSLTEVVTMLPMAVFQAFADIISGNPGAAFEDVANLLKGGLDAIEQLVDSLLGALGLDAIGTLLDKVFDLADGFDDWFGKFGDLRGILSDLFDVPDLLSGGLSIGGLWEAVTNNFIDSVGLFAKIDDLETFANGIADGLNSFPLFGPILGGIVNTAWDVIATLVGIGTNNANDIAALQTAVYTPPSGTAVGWVDEFDAAAADTLDLTKYTRTAYGTGSGHKFGIGGTGRTKWTIGSGVQSVVYIRTANPCTSAAQYASMIVSQRITNANNPTASLIIRSDSTAANCVRVRLTPFSIILEACTGNYLSPTTIATWSGNYSPGDKIEIFSGEGADIRKYLVKRQGAVVPGMNWVSESGSISNTSLLNIGVGEQNGNDFFSFPIAAPEITTLAGGDSTL